MVVGEASIHNIMGGMESTGGVRLHNHKRKLKQRFDIIKKLGQGTYGKVQLGINKETGQEVAIKTIKKCKIETEADLIRIRREIQIMSSVQHPNIIHIYEVFENREKMVLVMEYAAGGELYDYLSERKVLTEQEARRIFRQIATAVFYCHKHKICHRDLKLENILLDQVGNAKIADFGLSNVFDEQRLLNTFCGSPLYASPEIVKGTPYHGPEVDCWSLGVLLYTLVYGAMPFDGSNFKRLVKQISQSDYFEPKKPSPASPLIKDMLTVCPTRRADIERICTHWWVNETYDQNCLDIAEELAAQTPVRLDLLLSLVPQSASAEKLVVGDQQAAGDVANNMSSETLVPTRCHSVGSLMELDQNNSDRRIREMLDNEPRPTGSGDAKRKLETTPSMDETTAAGVKRKERSRKKDRTDEREVRAYKSASRHHSAPIPNAITEEAMEIDPIVTVPTSKTVDLNQIESTAACLELIDECKERSPSKERSRTPVIAEQEQPSAEASMQNTGKDYDINRDERTGEYLQSECAKSFNKDFPEEVPKSPESVKTVNKLANDGTSEKELNDSTSNSEMLNAGNINNRNENESSISDEAINLDATQREFKKLKEKALSLDSELSGDVRDIPAKTFERRRSKIFETAEKFNQMASNVENEKPKKIFIPGVNVGGAKRVFERKASLSSITTPPPVKASAAKVIIDVPTDRRNEKPCEKVKQNQEVADTEDRNKREEAKKRAVDIITGAIGKPPVQRKVNGSPPTSPPSQDSKKLPLKIQVAPNDLRSATISVSTPVDTKFPFDGKSTGTEAAAQVATEITNNSNSQAEEPKMSSKMEITLKSATLPRPRKTSKAEISLSGIKSPEPAAFKTEVEAKIDAFQPQKLRTQRSEIAFPVAAAIPQANRSSSLEPEGRPRTILPKERIIPIQVETESQSSSHSSTPPPKPPMPQRSMSQRSGSLSRQSTADSDTDSALGSTVGPEPIRKSPREYIIPIAVEGGGYVTPRSGSVEPESKTSTPTSTNAPRARFGRPRRMSSLLSDASEDESPFSTLHRDSEDLLQRHMHRLRSSRPSRQPPEHADSLSSGEDDDDDGFELLTAENLFSTLLSRVRSLTQRLNVDDNRSSGFPSSRLFGRLGSNSPQAFWGLNKPLSRRLTESPFRHSLSRDGDIFSRKDSANSSNPGTPGSPGSHGTSSRENVFDMGSNTLPRDKIEHEDVEAEPAQVRKETQETLEQNFTPSLARRLSRTFIEQTRQSLPRSPSVPYEKYYRSSSRDTLNLDASDAGDRSISTISDQTEYKDRLAERNIRRTNSLLEAGCMDRSHRRSPRRSISLFDDDDGDRLLSSFPRQIMTLGRKYKEASGKSNAGSLRRENFHSYKTDKIQEEPADDTLNSWRECTDNTESTVDGSTSECTSTSMCNSNTNLLDTTSSVSVKSYEISPTESSSNMTEYKSAYKPDFSRNFENRLLAAENLIKESKLRNLGPAKFNPNLSSHYRDTDKCDKESLVSMSEAAGSSVISKRRSCIPSLRLRSGSLTRESSIANDRRKSFTGSQDALGTRGASPEKSLLSKFFKASGSRDSEQKDKQSKPKQHRISRFLRPDFFDTPREESQYVKDKEAQKAAENERRKSRFIKRKSENKVVQESSAEEKREKELKNEINSLKRDQQPENPPDEKPNKDATSTDETQSAKIEKQVSRNSFLHTLEKKLEKLRSSEESSSKPVANGTAVTDQRADKLRENSAPPAECLSPPSGTIKKAISVEDLSRTKPSQNSAKSRVSSVLGLFKNSDSRQTSNGGRSQNTILSKLKKSPPKCTKGDGGSREDSPSTSRIPTKSAKSDSRIAKKLGEIKKPVEKVDLKRSPPKEKPKEKVLIVKDKKLLVEKQPKETKKIIERPMQLETQSSIAERKSKVETTDSLEKDSETTLSEEPVSKTMGRNQVESSSYGEDKKMLKTKKNSSLASNGLSAEETGKREDSNQKVKKTTKTKDSAEKEDPDSGTKKKKIVRVVKKVVKKSSDSSDSKTEEKGKTSKILVKKKSSSKIEKGPELAAPSGTVPKHTKSKENILDSQITGRSNSIETKLPTKGEIIENSERQSSAKLKPSVSGELASSKSSSKLRCSDRAKSVDGSSSLETRNGQSKPMDVQRGNRSSLKLDLSKIPQHSFRNTTPKRDSPKSDTSKPSSVESPKAVAKEDVPDKLIDCLSRMTHRASITGNKIIIDKPLRAKDVAELKREVTECARIIEGHGDSNNDSVSQSITDEITSDDRSEDRSAGKPTEDILLDRSDLSDRSNRIANLEERRKESPNDYTNELFSPIDEPESFDSWSVSSAEYNHTRNDLHSPTSPSHSLFVRSDNSESVIDRIRRRSFYSRFNDRKRPSLTVPPPGVTLPTSTTLPRKFSFTSYRDRDRDRDRDRERTKYSNYGTTKSRHGERSYGIYDEEPLINRNKSFGGRDRYTEGTTASPYISDFKSPSEHLPTLSSSYDPLRRYLRSPTFDLSTSRARYHSADFSVDSDLGSYRTPLSSFLNDSIVETHSGSSSATLPRKYGSSAEPKTVEYYEELLAPSNSDYLPIRRSPLPTEYLGRCENGYHNGNFDLHLGVGRRKSYTDKVASVEPVEGHDSELTEERRKRNERASETRNLPSTSAEPTSTCTAD